MYLFLLSEYFVFTLNYFPYYKLSNFPQVKKIDSFFFTEIIIQIFDDIRILFKTFLYITIHLLSLRIKENYTELIPLLPHKILLSLIHEFSFVYKGNDLQTKISLTLVPKVTTSILVLGLRTFPARNSPRSPTRWFYEMAMLDSRSVTNCTCMPIHVHEEGEGERMYGGRAHHRYGSEIHARTEGLVE